MRGYFGGLEGQHHGVLGAFESLPRSGASEISGATGRQASRNTILGALPRVFFTRKGPNFAQEAIGGYLRTPEVENP